MSFEKKITLCIPTFNRIEDVRQFLKGIDSVAGVETGFDVMVVDDASTDGTSEYIKENHPEVVLITLSKNAGPARARNIAIENCRTPFIAFFDSDAVPYEDWYENAIKYLDESTIIAGKVLLPDGRLGWGSRRSTFLGSSYPTVPEKANVASSCNMIVPVSLARRIGGFNEDFRIYFEDPEFCIRARIYGGGKVRYADDVAVIHYHDSLYNPAREQPFWRNKIMGMLWIHRGILKKSAFLIISFFLLLTRINRPKALLASTKGYFQGAWAGLTKRKDARNYRFIGES